MTATQTRPKTNLDSIYVRLIQKNAKIIEINRKKRQNKVEGTKNGTVHKVVYLCD